MTDKTELLPCPFCGSNRITVWNIRDGQQAVCKDCHAEGAPAFNGPGDDKTHAAAIAAWNRRPAVEAAPDLTETLEAAHMLLVQEYGSYGQDEPETRIIKKLGALLSAARAVSAPAAAPGGVEGWTAIPNCVIHGLLVGIEDAIKTFEHGKTRAKTKSDRGSQQLGIYHLECPLHRLKAVIEKQSISASPAAPAAQSGDGILWCAHVQGPDDVHPARDYSHAVEMCDMFNAISERCNFGFKPDDIRYVRSVAYPAIWPWGAASHAEGLASAPAPREA
ncbi:Lar family restriction alleviation protein [Azospirillum brasilense]|uniref:Lar family restriction alleviation protein n=1 Tax=Azospirillum brasilense TaxID=192 RepID=A0A560BNE3_AZOBR|nr:Lar family restriction alleviation protein [Azospirillum brasilense]TWA74133.1 Lar family restriction alleviation protein [Azospirillum brasilense]